MEPITSSDDDKVLYDLLYQNVKEQTVALEFFTQLKELGIHQFNKTLGSGCNGTVVQVQGPNVPPFALKVFKDTQENTFYANDPKGEPLALTLPSDAHLANAIGLFIFDGTRLQYTTTYNPQSLNGQVVLGVLSKSIPGHPLSTLFSQHKHFTPHQIKQLATQLAEAIHNLHGAGYAHKDIHSENILVHLSPSGPLLHLIDFGLASPLTPKRSYTDWRKFAYLLAEMGGQNLLTDPHYFDLLYSPKRGLLTSKNPYSEKEILSHPYFNS